MISITLSGGDYGGQEVEVDEDQQIVVVAGFLYLVDLETNMGVYQGKQDYELVK